MIFPPSYLEAGSLLPVASSSAERQEGRTSPGSDRHCGASFRDCCEETERQQLPDVGKGLWKRVRDRARCLEEATGWGGRWVREPISQTPCHTSAAALLLSADRLACCEG